MKTIDTIASYYRIQSLVVVKYHKLTQNWKKWLRCSSYICSWIKCLQNANCKTHSI